MTTATKTAPKSSKSKSAKKSGTKAPAAPKAEKAPRAPKVPKEPKPKRVTSASIVAEIMKNDPKLGFAEIVQAAVAKGVNENTARGALVRLKQGNGA